MHVVFLTLTLVERCGSTGYTLLIEPPHHSVVVLGFFGNKLFELSKRVVKELRILLLSVS